MTVSATPTRYQLITRCCSVSGGPYGLDEWFHLLSLRTRPAKAQISRAYGTVTEHSEARACLSLKRRRL